MQLYTCYLTSNDCYKSGKTITPKGVMVHSTGANNPNLRRYVQPDDGILGNNPNGNDWNESGIDVCVHAFIGKTAKGTVAIYQTLPWHYRGWHCGGSGNNTHISFEICEDNLSDKDYFNAVYSAAVELIAYLCNMYKLDPLADGVVICHSEGYQRGIASNHADVMHWFPRHGKDMNQFRADVAQLMKSKYDNFKEEQEVTYKEWKQFMEKYRQELSAKEVSSWAKDSVAEMVDKGVTDGKRPGDLTTREEVDTKLCRLLEKVQVMLE